MMVTGRFSKSATTIVATSLFAVLFAGTSLANAAITWNVAFNDVVNNTNLGFDDPTLGATRQATATSVLGYLNTVLDESGSADITFNNSQNDGTGFLASAGPFFFTGPNGFANGFVFDHATTGTDPTGAVVDGNVTFDFGYTWNSDTGAPTGSEFDMFTVLLHEFTHALGFLSLVDSAGNSNISDGDPGVFSVYDTFLERGDGTQLFGTGGDYLGTTGDLISDDIFFDGPNATAANGENPVPVYSPNPYNPGSSIGHITSAGAVMNFSVAPGVTKRAYQPLEIGILEDIGWTIAAGVGVPEPATLVLLGLGSALIAGRQRRRIA